MSILQWLRGKWAPGGSALPPPWIPRQSSFPELTRPEPPMPPVKPPNYVFMSGARDPLAPCADDRRFFAHEAPPPIPLGPTTIEIRDDRGRVIALGRGANLGEALTNLRKVTAP